MCEFEEKKNKQQNISIKELLHSFVINIYILKHLQDHIEILNWLIILGCTEILNWFDIY